MKKPPPPPLIRSAGLGPPPSPPTRAPLVEAELYTDDELPRVVAEIADRIDASPAAREAAIKTWQTVRTGRQLAKDMRIATTALFLRDRGTREWLAQAIKYGKDLLS